ncbi:helix-turn-helix domain-containing protein [Paenibacillus sp. N3.4]|uniref:helix-turn-helix domain-containing protein n=1 Tax=Paenibacillus sp. N3.4 TaxID=2603222 RepID=UPI0011C97AB4|nr:helix-turn-helix domain-containing protein [Paenibacillus sp. N3.4]TXK74471.1 hypothetical protein FU659_29320 [Paenibacillus sp. N3.4]
MENKGYRDDKEGSASFVDIFNRAQNGDNAAMEYLLQVFDQDIKYLARFTKMPHEEAVQALKVEFIAIVRNKIMLSRLENYRD